MYVDNYPVVLVHAQAPLTSTPEGACGYIDADMHDPDQILAAAAQTLDFTRPVGGMLVGVMQFAGEIGEARQIIDRLMAACPSGSYLTISHPASDIYAEQFGEATRRFNEAAPESERMTLRDHATVASLFSGFDLVPPGLVRVASRCADSEPRLPDQEPCGPASPASARRLIPGDRQWS